MLYLPAEFPHETGLCYLNHAAVAPWPRRAAEAVQAFAFENMRRGAADYPAWMAVQQRLRERLARLIQAPSPDDIALVKNTSEGLSLVAGGIDWRAGDRVIGIADDFPSNRVVWESLAPLGVAFDALDIHAGPDPEAVLISAITDKTRLMAVSSVHFATGARLDLGRLSAACREAGVWLCVDAIQSLGALRFDLSVTPADFVVADGHKWMLGPEGLGLFYVDPAIRDQLRLTQFGWAMREDAGDYDPGPWRPAASARRFECGSPNMLGIHALEASLSLLEEVGLDLVEQRLLAAVDHLRQGLEPLSGMEIVTPAARERHAGILAFQVAGQDSEALYRRLMAAGVICACRGGRVRLSPHFYTRNAVMDRAIEIIEQSSKL